MTRDAPRRTAPPLTVAVVLGLLVVIVVTVVTAAVADAAAVRPGRADTAVPGTATVAGDAGSLPAELAPAIVRGTSDHLRRLVRPGPAVAGAAAAGVLAALAARASRPVAVPAGVAVRAPRVRPRRRGPPSLLPA
jgi:hypothetical protein